MKQKILYLTLLSCVFSLSFLISCNNAQSIDTTKQSKTLKEEKNINLEKSSEATNSKLKKAYFAGGCFWGVEHFMELKKGVIAATSGYMGGKKSNPTYEDVSSKSSGHLEVVEVEYDSSLVDFKTLAKLFFEIHDPSQEDGQGPDIGPQYLSAIFYNDDSEKEISASLIKLLEAKGLSVATKLIAKTPFFAAETYHQDYYKKTGKEPYCHGYVKRF